MAELFDVKTRTPVDVPDNQVDTLLAAGTHTLPAGTSVPLKFDDGTYGSAPAENIQYALQQGAKVVTPTSAAIDEAVQDNKGLSGAGKVFAASLGNELLMGVPETIYKTSVDPLSAAKWQAIKESHNIADNLGTAAGIGASFIPGTPGAAIFGLAGKAGGLTERLVMGAARKAAAEAAAATGEQIATRTVTSAARDIAAKLAGATAEGAVITAPVALTEEALGDPDLAAETVLGGMGIGALVGTGTMGAKALLGLGKKGLEKASSLVGEIPSSGQKLAQIAAETSTGVKSGTIAKYLDNTERINQAPERAALKDQIDAHIDDFSAQLDLAKAATATTAEDMNTAYKMGLQDLRAQAAPESLRNELINDYHASKAKIGDLSQQINDHLENALGDFNTRSLKERVDKAADSMLIGKGEGTAGAVLGSESKSAYKELKNLSSQLESLPEKISASEARKIVQQIGENANYALPPGAFNSSSDKAFKGLRSYVRNELEKISPEAGSLMSQIHEISNRRQNLERYFGSHMDPGAIDAKLSGLLGKNKSAAVDALQNFGQVFDKNYMDGLDGLKNARALIAESAVKPIPDKIAPEMYLRNQQALQAHQELQDKYGELVKRMDRNKTENLINKLGHEKANIEDNRLMDKLDALTDGNFKQQIDDRNVLDSFNKKSGNGARKAMTGFATGSAIGGPVGGAIGAAAGYLGDVYSGKLLKAVLDKRPDVSGLLFVERKMKEAGQKLDQIPDILDSMSKKIPGTIKGRVIDVAAGVAESKRKKHENIDELKNKLTELQSNPNAYVNHLTQYSAPISTLGAPNVGAAFNSKMSVAYDYLNQNMPKPSQPTSPFAPQEVHKPSDYDMSLFNQKLQIIQDPYTILDELKNGTLTPTHVEAMKVVYPALYNSMKQKVQMHIINQKPKPMSYQGRVKLSMFMGAPTDQSMAMNNTEMYQHMYEIPDQTVDTRGGTPVELGEATMTDTQRRMQS